MQVRILSFRFRRNVAVTVATASHTHTLQTQELYIVIENKTKDTTSCNKKSCLRLVTMSHCQYYTYVDNIIVVTTITINLTIITTMNITIIIINWVSQTGRLGQQDQVQRCIRGQLLAILASLCCLVWTFEVDDSVTLRRILLCGVDQDRLHCQCLPTMQIQTTLRQVLYQTR